MIKKIRVEDLKPGMFVADTGLSWLEHPYLFTSPGLIRTERQVRGIVDEGYHDVFVDTEKGYLRDTAPSESMGEILAREGTPQTPKYQVSHAREMAPARKVQEDTLRFARDYIQDVRMGRQMDVGKAEPLVENIIDSVTRNADTLLSLTKLRVTDEYTYTHCINLAVISVVFGRFLGLSRGRLALLSQAALFHDVGKCFIPGEVLNKPGKLSNEEFNVIKSHPYKGWEMLKKQPGIQDLVLEGALCHHEKHNGKGYPQGISGGLITEFARIIAVADVYDALTSDRVYKRAILPNKALSLMFSMRGEDFAPGYVERFIKCMGIYPVGSLVRLSDGRAGVVAESNYASPLRPLVKVTFDDKMRPILAEEASLDKNRNLSIVHGLDHEAMGIDPLQLLT